MRLLRFDPAGVFDDAFGITRTQMDAESETLGDVRDSYREMSLDSELRRPEKLLTDYEALREKSDLGRVFRVANRLHDHIDAVAVLGDGDTLRGPIALMRACCEPFHNELPRSARGSKPRMYFAPSGFDNDALDGLRRRLGTGGDGPHAAEQRYAVIAIDAPNRSNMSSLATATTTQLLGDQLATSLGEGAARWMPKLMIPISPATGPVRELADRYACERDFQFDGELGGPLGIYSPATLLPAALLGLDCIQFLVGAAAMNEHFLSTSFYDNAVLQFVAVMRAMRRVQGPQSSHLQAWPQALDEFASWWQKFFRCSSLDDVAPGEHGLIHHLTVETARTDHLPIDASILSETFEQAAQMEKKATVRTLPDLMQAMIAKTVADQRTAGQPTTNLILSQIDTHSLGQLFQFAYLVRAFTTSCCS